jgi:hypothetical protein|tara:strand:+ start:60 stop:317 length:258 start_codon:yes stop_codon:yes gene_type:complete
MAYQRMSGFEVVLLLVGLGAGLLGFQLINRVYITEGELSWLMVIAIFNWLIMLVLLISLSLAVDLSRKELREIKNLVDILSKKKK